MYNRHFKQILKEANLPDITLYGLRHTCATILMAAGVNPKIVSERLGHSGVSITLDTYSHVLPGMQEQATLELENLLFSDPDTEDISHPIRTPANLKGFLEMSTIPKNPLFTGASERT